MWLIQKPTPSEFGVIADFDKLIVINPRSADAYYNRGVAKDYKGDYDGAVADYDNAIEINPKDALAYNNRGNAKRHKGDYDGAITDFDKATRLRRTRNSLPTSTSAGMEARETGPQELESSCLGKPGSLIFLLQPARLTRKRTGTAIVRPGIMLG